MSQPKKNPKDFPFRLTSLLTLGVFLITNTPLYSASTQPTGLQAASLQPWQLNQADLPEEFGKVEEIYQAPGKRPTVILIQDAHAIPDAQRSIQKIINHFQGQYGVGLVALEGASSYLDPQIFKSFPDKEVLKKTLEEYFERGELTGSAASAILNENDSIYRGIEDWSLYEQGIGFYLAAMKNSPALLEKFSLLEKDLQIKKEAIYSKELLEVDRAFQDFRENHTDLIKALKVFAETKRPEKGTELALLLEETEGEEGNQAPIDIEVKNVAKKIKDFLKAQPPSEKITKALRSFHEQLQEFQTSRISPQGFALFLKELTAGNNLPIKISGRLSHLIKNQKRMKDIEGTRFFRDFEQYGASIKSTLFRNEGERKLDQEGRRLYLAEKLTKLELSREEWEGVKAWGVGSGEWGVKAWGVGSEELGVQLAFYRNAEAREEAMLKNMQKLLRPTPHTLLPTSGSSPRSALLIAGGFHTEGLTEKFKQAGISYLFVTPKIESIPDETHYRDHMRGEVSWKDYFRVENGKVDLYKAFVRAVRDRLLAVDGRRWTVDGKSERLSFHRPPSTVDRLLLKRWRDQIIRDLAAKEKITSAGNYTVFLDEVGEKDQPAHSSIAERLQKIDRFIEGLRQLETQGRLTHQNLMKLLKPSAIPAMPIALELDPYAASGIMTGEAGRSEMRMPGETEGRPDNTISKEMEKRRIYPEVIQRILPELLRLKTQGIDIDAAIDHFRFHPETLYRKPGIVFQLLWRAVRDRDLVRQILVKVDPVKNDPKEFLLQLKDALNKIERDEANLRLIRAAEPELEAIGRLLVPNPGSVTDIELEKILEKLSRLDQEFVEVRTKAGIFQGSRAWQLWGTLRHYQNIILSQQGKREEQKREAQRKESEKLSPLQEAKINEILGRFIEFPEFFKEKFKKRLESQINFLARKVVFLSNEGELPWQQFISIVGEENSTQIPFLKSLKARLDSRRSEARQPSKDGGEAAGSFEFLADDARTGQVGKSNFGQEDKIFLARNAGGTQIIQDDKGRDSTIGGNNDWATNAGLGVNQMITGLTNKTKSGPLEDPTQHLIRNGSNFQGSERLLKGNFAGVGSKEGRRIPVIARSVAGNESFFLQDLPQGAHAGTLLKEESDRLIKTPSGLGDAVTTARNLELGAETDIRFTFSENHASESNFSHSGQNITQRGKSVKDSLVMGAKSQKSRSEVRNLDEALKRLDHSELSERLRVVKQIRTILVRRPNQFQLITNVMEEFLRRVKDVSQEPAFRAALFEAVVFFKGSLTAGMYEEIEEIFKSTETPSSVVAAGFHGLQSFKDSPELYLGLIVQALNKEDTGILREALGALERAVEDWKKSTTLYPSREIYQHRNLPTRLRQLSEPNSPVRKRAVAAYDALRKLDNEEDRIKRADVKFEEWGRAIPTYLAVIVKNALNRSEFWGIPLSRQEIQSYAEALRKIHVYFYDRREGKHSRGFEKQLEGWKNLDFSKDKELVTFLVANLGYLHVADVASLILSAYLAADKNDEEADSRVIRWIKAYLSSAPLNFRTVDFIASKYTPDRLDLLRDLEADHLRSPEKKQYSGTVWDTVLISDVEKAYARLIQKGRHDQMQSEGKETPPEARSEARRSRSSGGARPLEVNQDFMYQKTVVAVLAPDKLSRSELREVSTFVEVEAERITVAAFAKRFKTKAMEAIRSEARLAVVENEAVSTDEFMIQAIDEVMDRWVRLIKAREQELVGQNEALPVIAADILPEDQPLTVEGLIDALLQVRGQLDSVLFTGDTKQIDPYREKLAEGKMHYTTIGNLNTVTQSRINHPYLTVVRKSNTLLPAETSPLQLNIGVRPGGLVGKKWNPVLDKGESSLQVVLALLLAITVESAGRFQDPRFQSQLLSGLFEGKIKGEALTFEIRQGKDGKPRISVNIVRPFLFQYLQVVAGQIRARSEVRKAA